MQTLDAACRATAGTLRKAGIETPALDARLLLCEAAGLTHEALVARGREAIAPVAAERLSGFVARRLDGEPVSRIMGSREFYGRDFQIGRETLDPRPDTETLIEAALDVASSQGWHGRPLDILDLGTGSGCILLTLLAELPKARGLGTDVAEGALRVAGENAQRLGLQDRARFAQADWFEGLEGSFDLIVSNPPYIAGGAISALRPEVAAYDPRGALYGGPDGLDAYRVIAAQAPGFLAPGGHLLVEIGAGQAEAVLEFFRAAGLIVGEESLRLDLAGRPRVILASSPL